MTTIKLKFVKDHQTHCNALAARWTLLAVAPYLCPQRTYIKSLDKEQQQILSIRHFPSKRAVYFAFYFIWEIWHFSKLKNKTKTLLASHHFQSNAYAGEIHLYGMCQRKILMKNEGLNRFVVSQ